VRNTATLQQLRDRLSKARLERAFLIATSIKLRWQLSVTAAKFAALMRGNGKKK